MTKHPEATPQNLYQITGNVADMNTVLIERAELRRLQAENDGVHALIARNADVIDFRDSDSDPHVAQMVEFLKRFAELVAAAERRKHQADIERWKTEAATAEKWRGLALSKEGDGRTVQRIQQEAAAFEREACAALCDDMAQEEQGKVDRDYSREDTAEELAVWIRARGQH